jgi:hypothetical protein
MAGIAFPRPTTAQNKYSTDKIIGQAIEELQTVDGITAPIAGASLPLQEYATADKFDQNIICAGTIKAINDDFGVLLHDSVAGDTNATYVTVGRVLMQATALTYAKGEIIYLNSSTMVVTNASASLLYPIGTCDSLVLTNPTGYPAGSYVWVRFNGIAPTVVP